MGSNDRTPIGHRENSGRQGEGVLGHDADIDAAMIDAMPQSRDLRQFRCRVDGIDALTRARAGVMVGPTPRRSDRRGCRHGDRASPQLPRARTLPGEKSGWPGGSGGRTCPYRLTPGTLCAAARSSGHFTGLGRIGQAVARRIEAFGLPISYHTRRQVEGVSSIYRRWSSSPANVDTL